MSHSTYHSPLASRYASDYMLRLFSDDSRYQTWRRLWTALARAQHQLGLPITAEQVAELEAHITDIDYDVAAVRLRQGRPVSGGYPPSGRYQLLRHRQRRPDFVPGRPEIPAWSAAGGAGQSGGLC